MSKDFWEQQAAQFRDDVKAVNFDPLQEELELFFIEKFIGDKEYIFDMGCGNGRTLISLAQKKKDSIFYGADFAKGMIEAAEAKRQEIDLENLNLYHVDAASSDLPRLLGVKFDKILTKRLLINLKGDLKYRALDNIHAMLKTGGTYLMVECFSEPLEKINNVRKLLDLEEIRVKSFNEYLSFNLFSQITNQFVVDEKIDFASLYYFVSRTFNAFLSEGQPDYYSPVNKLAVDLIKKGINPIEGYSPEIMFILKKR